MKVKFNRWCNILLAALITALGFGACKCSKGVKGVKDILDPSAPHVPEEIRDVYGPPPMYEQPDLPDEPETEVLEINENDSV